MPIPVADRPQNLSFLKPNNSWPVIRQVVSDQGHYIFLYGHTKHNRVSGGKEQTNKRGRGSAPSARGGSLWHPCAALRAFAGYRGRIFARNFHKAPRNADCPAFIFSLSPSAVSFSGQLSQAGCSLLPYFVKIRKALRVTYIDSCFSSAVYTVVSPL